MLDSELTLLGTPNVLLDVRSVGTFVNGDAVVAPDDAGGLALKRLDEEESELGLKRKLAEVAPLAGAFELVVVVVEAGGIALNPLNPENVNAGLSLSLPEFPLLDE